MQTAELQATITPVQHPISLGPLERRILSCLWQHKAWSVRDVYLFLASERTIAYTTVLTILTRLHRKGLVVRKKQGKAHVYSARLTKQQLAGNLLRETLSSLNEKFGIDAIAAFADEIKKLPPKTRRQLASRLKGVR